MSSAVKRRRVCAHAEHEAHLRSDDEHKWIYAKAAVMKPDILPQPPDVDDETTQVIGF